MDDSTIESDNASNSAEYEPSDSDGASDDSVSDDGRSLVDSLPRREPTHVIYRSPSLDGPEVVEEESKEENFSFFQASKKDKKKWKATEREFVVG